MSIELAKIATPDKQNYSTRRNAKIKVLNDIVTVTIEHGASQDTDLELNFSKREIRDMLALLY